jgi:hypothetical protein
MATDKVMIQRFNRTLQQKYGRDLSAMELVEELVKAGMKLPVPKDPKELLAKKVADALREEERIDKETGFEYRANVAYESESGFLWGDIDKVDRRKMESNYAFRRNQIVGDAFGIKIDCDHWNRIHPNEEPIEPELDFTLDVEWKLNAPRNPKGKAA